MEPLLTWSEPNTHCHQNIAHPNNPAKNKDN